MQYFNAVLRPSEDVSHQLIKFAQDYFVDFAKGYCLSDEVYPHITLCQFKAEKLPDIEDFDVKKLPHLTEYYVEQQGDICWVALDVEPENWLLMLQSYIVKKLQERHVEILTKHYRPHLTFCCVDKNDFDKAKNIVIPKEFLGVHEGWYFEVGRSDENGQYLGGSL